MRSLCTVVTLGSVLQPRYVAFRQSFVPWCGFPGSSSKGHKGRLIRDDERPSPRQCWHFFSCHNRPCRSPPLFPSMCVCYGWKRRGSEEAGSRKSHIPAQASPACCLNSPIYSCSHSHRGVAPPCCSLSAAMRAPMCPYVDFLYQVTDALSLQIKTVLNRVKTALVICYST